LRLYHFNYTIIIIIVTLKKKKKCSPKNIKKTKLLSTGVDDRRVSIGIILYPVPGIKIIRFMRNYYIIINVCRLTVACTRQSGRRKTIAINRILYTNEYINSDIKTTDRTEIDEGVFCTERAAATDP